MKHFVISENDAGQRLDKFLTKAVPLLPQTLLYKSIRLKRIKLNGKRCEISTRLTVGDQLELYLNDEFFVAPNDTHAFLLAPNKLTIVYEDENILLVDKPVGLVVHEDEQGGVDTLINRILHHLYARGDYRPSEEQSFIPALCNRIDRNTQGIVIAAKNAAALRILNEKIKEREIEKQYLCIVHGQMPKSSDTLKAFLTKDESRNQVTVTDYPTPDGRTILTRYHVLEERGRFSLLEVDLLTGRTHQIRAHLAHVGHPLLGDAKYGHNRDNRDTGYRFQTLCAHRITFTLPTDSGPLEYLRSKSFSIKDVAFREEFLAGKIR